MHRLEHAVLALHVERVDVVLERREAPLMNAVQAAGTGPPTWAAVSCIQSYADCFGKCESKLMFIRR